MGQPRPLYCLFSFLSQCNNKYSCNLSTYTLKHECCDQRGIRPGPQDGGIEDTDESTRQFHILTKFLLQRILCDLHVI